MRVLGPDYLTFLPCDSSSGTPRTDTLHPRLLSVQLISYANGTREMSQPTAFLSAVEARAQGLADVRYYKPRGAYWGTFGASMVSPVGGVLAIAALRGTPPKLANMPVPDAELLHDPNYVAAYRQQAQRQKGRKAGAGLGTALGVDALLLLLVVAFSTMNGW